MVFWVTKKANFPEDQVFTKLDQQDAQVFGFFLIQSLRIKSFTFSIAKIFKEILELIL